ncbi:MAG: hypothetical protein HKN09_01420 [Saprospiraceae bacterium]|nr:hypothetical protein [Saprospiraceae bacterium]
MFKNVIYAFVFVALFASCKTYNHIQQTDVVYENTEGKNYTEDASISEFIGPYRDEMNIEMGVVIGEMPETLRKSRPNSNMGNWFSDVLLSEAQRTSARAVDFAIQNYGGLRIPTVAKGPLKVGTIYELMPFDNLLVILDLNVNQVQMLLDKIADGGGWPISRNITFTIQNKKATNIKIKGEALGTKKMYRVAMPDYIANGGDNCDFLKPLPQDNSGKFIREVVIEHLRLLAEANKPITVDNSKRIN